MEQRLERLAEHRKHLEAATSAFARVWECLEGETIDAEARHDESYRHLAAARVRTRVRALWTTAILAGDDERGEEQNFAEAFITRQILRGAGERELQGGSGSMQPCRGILGEYCRWCSWGGHASDQCDDPHFHCTPSGGCVVPHSHQNWSTRHRCMAAPEWAGHEANAELLASRRAPTPEPAEPPEPPAIQLV